MSILAGTPQFGTGLDLSINQRFGGFSGIRFDPKMVTITYLILGFLLLIFSDLILPQYFQDPRLAEFQAVKGGMEIILTGIIIFAVSNHGQSQLHQRNEDVKQHREELAVLHRVLRHNLRNDLTIIDGQAELIESNTSNENTRERAKTIRSQVNETISYTKNANKIRRLRQVDNIKLNLHTTARDIVKNHPLVDESVEVNFDINRNLNVRVKPLFEEAMKELITNSIRHKDSDTLIIEVSAYRDPEDPGWIIIEASDNGPGMIADVLEVMKEGNHSQLMHLEGLGLWFIYWTVVESGGSYDIEVSDGTMVKMRLPAA